METNFFLFCKKLNEAGISSSIEFNANGGPLSVQYDIVNMKLDGWNQVRGFFLSNVCSHLISFNLYFIYVNDTNKYDTFMN